MLYHTIGAKQTRLLGACLARRLCPGDVLLLEGDMGAGKSEFTRGVARGLGIPGYVTSPTFTILQVHEGGRLPLYHFDWYRLSGASELYELSMDEYLYHGGVAVVEWPERAPEAIPETHLRVTLVPTGDEERDIRLEPRGGFRELAALADDWTRG